MARFGLGGMRLTNSLGLNLAVCEFEGQVSLPALSSLQMGEWAPLKGVYELHIHARLFCPRGGSPSEAVKAVRTPGPGSLDCLRSRSTHSLEVGMYNNQWVVSKGKRPG